MTANSCRSLVRSQASKFAASSGYVSKMAGIPPVPNRRGRSSLWMLSKRRNAATRLGIVCTASASTAPRAVMLACTMGRVCAPGPGM